MNVALNCSSPPLTAWACVLRNASACLFYFLRWFASFLFRGSSIFTGVRDFLGQQVHASLSRSVPKQFSCISHREVTSSVRFSAPGHEHAGSAYICCQYLSRRSHLVLCFQSRTDCSKSSLFERRNLTVSHRHSWRELCISADRNSRGHWLWRRVKLFHRLPLRCGIHRDQKQKRQSNLVRIQDEILLRHCRAHLFPAPIDKNRIRLPSKEP